MTRVLPLDLSAQNRAQLKKAFEFSLWAVLAIVLCLAIYGALRVGIPFMMSGETEVADTTTEGAETGGGFWSKFERSPAKAEATGDVTESKEVVTTYLSSDEQCTNKWIPLEVGPVPKRFNKKGVCRWKMEHPLGCINVKLAGWNGGTELTDLCDNGGPDIELPVGGEWVWSANGHTFPAMLKLIPDG